MPLRLPADVRDDQVLALLRANALPKRAKFNNVASHFDGYYFQSLRELHYYRDLVLLQRTGVITDLQVQAPTFVLHAVNLDDGEVRRIGTYTADFYYRLTDSIDRRIVDTKGFKTKIYLMKKAHTEAEYGIRIIEA